MSESEQLTATQNPNNQQHRNIQANMRASVWLCVRLKRLILPHSYIVHTLSPAT